MMRGMQYPGQGEEIECKSFYDPGLPPGSSALKSRAEGVIWTLTAETEYTARLAAELEAKCWPVMSPAGPEAVNNTGDVAKDEAAFATAPPLYQTLMSLTLNLSRANAALSEICQRLEL